MLLKLIQHHTKAGRVLRALDLATRLTLPDSFGIAIRIAKIAEKPKLAERMDLLRQALMVAQEEAVEEEEEEEAELVKEETMDYNTMHDQRSNKRSYEDNDGGSHSNKRPRTQSGTGRVANENERPSNNAAGPVNPFAKRTIQSPSKPQKDLAGTLRSLKSPVKIEPKISRESSFAQNLIGRKKV
jgi:hypothetical protein